MKYQVDEESIGFTAYSVRYPTVKFTAGSEHEALMGVKNLLAVMDLDGF